jgi:hypothetical protein
MPVTFSSDDPLEVARLWSLPALPEATARRIALASALVSSSLGSMRQAHCCLQRMKRSWYAGVSLIKRRRSIFLQSKGARRAPLAPH